MRAVGQASREVSLSTANWVANLQAAPGDLQATEEEGNS